MTLLTIIDTLSESELPTVLLIFLIDIGLCIALFLGGVLFDNLRYFQEFRVHRIGLGLAIIIAVVVMIFVNIGVFHNLGVI